MNILQGITKIFKCSTKFWPDISCVIQIITIHLFSWDKSNTFFMKDAWNFYILVQLWKSITLWYIQKLIVLDKPCSTIRCRRYLICIAWLNTTLNYIFFISHCNYVYCLAIIYQWTLSNFFCLTVLRLSLDWWFISCQMFHRWLTIFIILVCTLMNRINITNAFGNEYNKGEYLLHQ